MLVRNTTSLYPDLFLVKLGDTCRYVIRREDRGLIIFDPGASVHAELLIKRIETLGFDSSDIKGIILTRGTYAQFGSIPAIKRIVPSVEVMVPAAVASELEDREFLSNQYENDASIAAQLKNPSDISLNEWKHSLAKPIAISDGFHMQFSQEGSIHAVATPGHGKASLAYLIQPHRCLIADQTFGYFNGNKLAGPGGDFDLEKSLRSIEKFATEEIAVLALPFMGAITGLLVRKHLDALVQNSEDLISEVRLALADNVPAETIRKSVLESFFTQPSRDPFLQSALSRTFERVCEQLGIPK